MKLEEARKLGTGPLTYNKKERVLLTSSHAALLAHYYNHFEALVDALEKTQALYSGLVNARKMRPHYMRGSIKEHMDNLISVYTRQQAIEDGIFVDVSKVAKQNGFLIPVAITTNLFNSHIKQPDDKETSVILSQFLSYISKVVSRNRGNSLINDFYNFHGPSGKRGVRAEVTEIWIATEAQSPTDDSLGLTIMLPEDY